MTSTIYDKQTMTNIVDKFLYLATDTKIVTDDSGYKISFGPYMLDVWPDSLEEGVLRCQFWYKTKVVCTYDFGENVDKEIINALLVFCHTRGELENNKKIIQDFLNNY